jgi:hypothetical protein
MFRSSAAAGLCAGCKHERGCIHATGCGNTIVHCRQSEPDMRWDRSFMDAAYVGLCATCENRAICIYPKPEGGVWRCEEYV